MCQPQGQSYQPQSYGGYQNYGQSPGFGQPYGGQLKPAYQPPQYQGFNGSTQSVGGGMYQRQMGPSRLPPNRGAPSFVGNGTINGPDNSAPSFVGNGTFNEDAPQFVGNGTINDPKVYTPPPGFQPPAPPPPFQPPPPPTPTPQQPQPQQPPGMSPDGRWFTTQDGRKLDMNIFNPQRLPVTIDAQGLPRVQTQPFDAASGMWGRFGSPKDANQGAWGWNPQNNSFEINGRTLNGVSGPDDPGAQKWLQHFKPMWDAQRGR